MVHQLPLTEHLLQRRPATVPLHPLLLLAMVVMHQAMEQRRPIMEVHLLITQALLTKDMLIKAHPPITPVLLLIMEPHQTTAHQMIQAMQTRELIRLRLTLEITEQTKAMLLPMMALVLMMMDLMLLTRLRIIAKPL